MRFSWVILFSTLPFPSHAQIHQPTLQKISGNTVSYASAYKGVYINLNMKIGFILEQETPLRIMPLGDSITRGITAGIITDQADGYRLGLWQRLNALGLNFDFVGSQSNGTDALPDKNHEGHGGWKINHIANGKKKEPGTGIDNWIPAYNPDVILLMIGTNNMDEDPNNAANNLLSKLIDKIIYNYPEFAGGKLLVASIPPVRPNSYYYDRRMPNIRIYNALIPTLVRSKPASENVSFVDTWVEPTGLTEADMSLPPDNGLHPSVFGYDKLAQIWFDALLSQTGEKNNLGHHVVNVEGSAFDDVLVGDARANLLTGGAGADSFVYQAPSDAADILTDFNGAEGDVIKISASGFGHGLKVGTRLGNGTSTSTSIFIRNASPTPLGNQPNFLYNTITGLLKFDPDGAGSKPSVSLLTLAGGPQLNANQILIIH